MTEGDRMPEGTHCHRKGGDGKKSWKMGGE